MHSFTDDQGGLAPPPSNVLVPDIKPTPPSSERGPGSARSSDKVSSARRPSASKRSSAGRSKVITFNFEEYFDQSFDSTQLSNLFYFKDLFSNLLEIIKFVEPSNKFVEVNLVFSCDFF